MLSQEFGSIKRSGSFYDDGESARTTTSGLKAFSSEEYMDCMFRGSATIFNPDMVSISREFLNSQETTTEQAINIVSTITNSIIVVNEIIYGYSSLAGMSYLPIQLFLNFENNSSQMMLFFMSLFIVSIIIIEYIIFFIIPSKAQDYLEKTYPEYQLSNQ